MIADVIVGITQIPLYIILLSLARSLIEEFFWNCFLTWKATGH